MQRSCSGPSSGYELGARAATFPAPSLELSMPLPSWGQGQSHHVFVPSPGPALQAEPLYIVGSSVVGENTGVDECRRQAQGRIDDPPF